MLTGTVFYSLSEGGQVQEAHEVLCECDRNTE